MLSNPAKLFYSILALFLTLLVTLQTSFTSNLQQYIDKQVTIPEISARQHIEIPVYGFYLYETSFILQVLTSKLPFKILLKDHADFLVDWNHNTLPYQHAIFIIGNDVPRDIDFGNEHISNYLRSHGTLLHFSDEGLNHNVKMYDHFSRVYRNYYNTKADRASSLEYLKGVHDNSTVKWIPLGFSNNLLSSSNYNPRIKSRKLSYFWSASLAGKPERSEFADALKAAPEIKGTGKYFTYGVFQSIGSSEFLGQNDYTRLMHNARVIPCPSGGSPEQFRIYEALESGAIPIVKAGHEALTYLEALGLEHLTVSKWSEAVAHINDSMNNEAFIRELQTIQNVNNMRWKDIKEK